MSAELLNAALNQGLAEKIGTESLPVNSASLSRSMLHKDLDFVFKYMYIKVVFLSLYLRFIKCFNKISCVIFTKAEQMLKMRCENRLKFEFQFHHLSVVRPGTNNLIFVKEVLIFLSCRMVNIIFSNLLKNQYS